MYVILPPRRCFMGMRRTLTPPAEPFCFWLPPSAAPRQIRSTFIPSATNASMARRGRGSSGYGEYVTMATRFPASFLLRREAISMSLGAVSVSGAIGWIISNLGVFQGSHECDSVCRRVSAKLLHDFEFDRIAACAMVFFAASRAILASLEDLIAFRICESSNLRRISMLGMTQCPPMAPGKYFVRGKKEISS